MADEGPTTVGSIDATLKLDISNFEEKADIAKAEAKELGALSPEIKVDADTGPALAKLNAAGLAVDGLGRRIQGLTAAELAENQAQGRAAQLSAQSESARKQEMQTQGALTNKLLDETIARKNAAAAEKYEADQVIWNTSALKQQLDARNASTDGTVKESFATDKLASAQRSLQIAEANLDKVNKDSTSSLQQKLSAQNAVASATRRLADETDNDTNSTNKNTVANNQRVSGLQVLIGLAPAILAAAAPIGAAAIGLGASFGVMAVAGVLAVKGIKDEMAQGTTAGNAYADGLGQLKGDLNELAQTSAVSMLGSFNTVVGDLSSRMPFLNQLVGEASSMLGNMGGVALAGVLNGLQAMNPLIQASGVELGKFVGWLAGMTSSNGFTQFVQYAITNLPGVMHLIESLVTLAGNILAAFAPLGPGVVAVLSAITDGLNSLPLPVLAGIVTAATLISPAMNVARGAITMFASATGVAASEVTVFGIASNLAIPVVGILTAALAAIGVAAASGAIGTNTATQATQDYTQALIDDNNAIGVHVQAQSAKALADSGAAQASVRLGISLQTTQQAALGNADAMATVKAATDKAAQGIVTMASGGAYASASNKQLSADVDLMRNSVLSAGPALDDQIAKQKLYNQIMQDSSGATGTQNTALATLAASYGMSVAQYQAATTAQQSTAAQLAQTTANMQMQNDAAGILKGTLDLLNGKSISAAQAQNAFDSSLVNMGDHVTAAGKQVHFTTSSINDMSSASVALRGQLNSQITNLQNVVAANGGLANSTGAAREQMVNMRAEIINNAVAHGIDRDAVTAYIDKLFQIPKSVPPTKIQADTAAALAAIRNYQANVDALHGNTVWITTHIDSIYSDTHVSNGQGGSGGQTKSSGGLVYRADGGSVLSSYLASGGHPGHAVGTDIVPAWLTPDEYVVKRSSAQSIGTPALDYMNRTGKLPPSGGSGGGGPVTVNLVLDGQIIDTRIVDLSTATANSAITNANNYAGRRPSR